MSTRLDPWSIELGTTSLVEASAGTGKTHAISTLFVRLVVEARLGVDRILVVTFTEAAAAELRERIRSRLHAALAELVTPGDDDIGVVLRERRAQGFDDAPALADAIRSFDIATISTIHGFCHGVLQRHAFETGVALHTELITDDGPMLDEIVRDHIARELYDADPELVGSMRSTPRQHERLLRLARLVVAHPELVVEPASSDAGPLPDRGPYEHAFGECRRLWLAHEADIRAIVRSPDRFKNYLKKIDGHLRRLEQALGRPTASGLVAPGTFAPFTQAELRANTLKSAGQAPQHPFFAACDQLLAHRQVVASSYARHALAFKLELVRYARKEAPLRKKLAGVQSFDDLLHHLDGALRTKTKRTLIEQLRGRFAAALIDEFQDTDPIQYRIFKTLFGKSPSSLLLIGDPKQAIYGFRGADVYAYLGAARDVGRRRMTMRNNWRSDPGLLDAVAELFAVDRPFVIDDIEFVPVEPRPGARNRLTQGGAPLSPFHIGLLPRRDADPDGGPATELGARDLPRRIAADIAGMLGPDTRIDDGTPEGRSVHAGDIAVLTRRNAQAIDVQAELRRLGIPSVVYGDSTVFESKEATELALVLEAIAEPSQTRRVRAALATELLGATATQLAHLGQDDDTWERWVDLFRQLGVTWHGRGFIQMFRTLLVETEAGRRLLSLTDGERRMTNLLHLAELLHATAGERHLGPLALLQWFDEQRRQRNTMVEAFKLRLERDDRAVQLITIHRSKGLEYPIVYCPYSWEGDGLRGDEQEDLLYHTDDAEKQQRLDLRPRDDAEKQAAIALAEIERKAEAHRLLYVALTRARHRCFVVWHPRRPGDSALGTLLTARPKVDRPGFSDNIYYSNEEETLARLRARGGDRWTAALLPAAEPSDRPVHPELAPPELVVRRPRAAIDRLWRTSSFSNLASSQTTGGPLFVDFADARAHDEALVAPIEPTIDALWTTERAPPATSVTLADFPRGIAAGNFFHDLIEHLDFTADEPTRRQAVVDALGAHGLGPTTWATTVDAALGEILTAPLAPATKAGAPLRLCDVPRTTRLDELEFLLPAGGLDVAIGRNALARVFHDHPEGLPDGYGDRVATLGFSPLRGFLKGFIDMVFVADEKWWVVDYKTNHLGATPQDYARDRLDRAMADDHYILQYHLYAVALVRMLALRVPGFDYDRHFGGALYLFVRGMSPSHPGLGVWHERPPRARIQALSNLLEHGQRVGGGAS